MNHLDWTGSLPDHWQIKPLRAVAECRISTVDKKEIDGEQPVRLCNYTDVYNNDFISLDMDFMRATASDLEIAQFRLLVGDVIITKDSETWEDIGVPALVTETADDLVCGYHLALLRPGEAIHGRFLLRILQARQVQVQLELAAKGMTRFGLPKLDIGKLVVPVPPLADQMAIADYVDRETAALDNLKVAAMQAIELAKERRVALISAAVTGEIDVDTTSVLK